MSNLKKKIVVLAVITLLPLVLVGSIIVIIDPFFVYHPPLEKGYYIVDNQLEQNPGIAKNFAYDSVMLGSSMTTNFDTNLFNERLGCQMVKLSYNAAFPHDIDKIMNIVVQEQEGLTHAFLCIDIANYMDIPGKLSYTYPEHLYDNKILNDLKYLLNKDVLMDYIFIPYLKKSRFNVNEIYWHWQYMPYGKEYVLRNYSIPQKEQEETTQYSIANLKENLDTYIAPYIDATPDTEWHVFFPPYSILYWNNSVISGELDAKLQGMAYITEYLAEFDNVEISYFQDSKEWISDLNHYTDLTHYSKEVTDSMTEQLCNGSNRVTIDSYKERLEAFGEYVISFDYEELLEN